MRKFILLSLLFLISICGIEAQSVSPHYVDGTLYVKLTDDYPLTFKVDVDNGRTINESEFPFLQELFAKYGVTLIAQEFYLFDDEKLLRTLTIWFSEVEKADEFIAELLLHKEIEYAEKPTIKKQLFNPDDPYCVSIDNINMNWHLDMIKASYAWDLQRGSPDIKVAIVDNAVWGEHEDLQISSDNLCYFKELEGVPTAIIGSASPPSSVNQNMICSVDEFNTYCDAYYWSHGTHCAGLAGAITNNGKGIASIGSGVSLMGVRMARDDGILIYDNEGVQWAADNGAKVISMSYGSPVPEQTGRQVLQTAYEHGIILVAAAGNEAKESPYAGYEPNHIIYPAGYPFVIGVASVNNNRKLSSFSQYGADRADIAAPGGFTVINNREWLPTILSTTYCKTQLLRLIGFNFSDVYYDAMHGTSMACPIVSGLCGLLASAYPDITPAQAKECLQSTAQPLAPGSNQIGGNGIINAYSAVLCAQELAGNVGICDKLTLTNQISVYPNPAQDILYVVSEEGEVKKIEILDVAGRCVVTEQMPKSETILSISNLTSGLYLLKFTCSNNEIIIKKFIKQ